MGWSPRSSLTLTAGGRTPMVNLRAGGAALDLALQAARSRVERTHGPPYPGDGKLFRMSWDLRGEAFTRNLSLGRRCSEVISARMSGADLGPETYRLQNELVLVNNFFEWFWLVSADVRPIDDRVERSAMIQALADKRLHPEENPRSELEILAAIPLPGAVYRYPVMTEVIDEPPGE